MYTSNSRLTFGVLIVLFFASFWANSANAQNSAHNREAVSKIEVSGELNIVADPAKPSDTGGIGSKIIEALPELISSIVIATVGYFITRSITNSQISASEATAEAQIRAANIRAENEMRLQQGELTGKLMEHLTSSERTTRELAVVALRQSVPSEIYDPVVTILAESDGDEGVRTAAIRELGTSQNTGVAKRLNKIGRDQNRPEAERRLAFTSASSVSISSIVPANTAILTATSWGEHAYEVDELKGGIFTHFLLSSLTDWQKGNSETLNVDDLFKSIQSGMSGYRAESRPTLLVGENGVFPFIKREANYQSINGLAIGINEYSGYPGGSLRYCKSDAEKVAAALQALNISNSNIQFVYDEEATSMNILERLDELAQSSTDQGLFIVYFAGHSFLSNEGELGLVSHDWSPGSREGFVPISSIMSAFEKSKSSNHILILDTDNAATVERLIS